jgi:hypothetical protein
VQATESERVARIVAAEEVHREAFHETSAGLWGRNHETRRRRGRRELQAVANAERRNGLLSPRYAACTKHGPFREDARVAEDPIEPDAPEPLETRVDRLWAFAARAVIRAVVAGLAVVVLALLNNNYASDRSRATRFSSDSSDRLNRRRVGWRRATTFSATPALMFMIMDMEKMSGDPRLQRLLDDYRKSTFVSNPQNPLHTVWARMVDSQATVPVIDARGIPAGDIHEILWVAHAIAPDRVLISPDERANLFSRTKYFWGRRNHQLFALDSYRYYNGGSPELDSTLAHLAKKVARDEHFDFRVNDSYPQRISFVLAAHQPDLIRSRWVERVINNQAADGHWSYCWHSWCKGVMDFSADDPDPSHATVQAAWALTLLKHRFPQWIERNYR